MATKKNDMVKIKFTKPIARLGGKLRKGDVATYPKKNAENFIKSGKAVEYLSDVDLAESIAAIEKYGGAVVIVDKKASPALVDAVNESAGVALVEKMIDEEVAKQVAKVEKSKRSNKTEA